MVFGGLQKYSLIDFPGKISCVIFLAGCNFDCPFCHNPDLVKGTPSVYLNQEDLFNFLEKRRGFLDGVVISGGEPTLCRELAGLCDTIKQMGYTIKLDTNGSRPDVIRKLIDESLVDYIAMDIKTDPSGYASLLQAQCTPRHIISSIQVIMQSSIDYEFRTTCVKPLVDARIIAGISMLVKDSMLYALQQFHNTRVLYPELFQSNESRYDDDDLLYFKSIAEPWVKKCVVR